MYWYTARLDNLLTSIRILRYSLYCFPLYIFYIAITMTDRRREKQIYQPRSTYMYYMHTTDLSMRNERQRQIAELDEEIRQDEAMLLKRMHDSRMKTEKAIQEIRLEQERRLIKEEQKRQEHEERRRARKQNREELERELARIKHELRGQLAKEDMKRQKAEQESQQHKEEEQKRLTIMQEREVCYKQTESSQPSIEIKAQEQMSRNEDKQSTASGQEYERIQDETEEDEQRKDAERDNENEAFIEEKKISDEKRETEVQTGYRKKTHEDSLINDNTSQIDGICSSVPHDQLNISCAKIATLEKLQNIDRQKKSGDQALEVCIVQECVSDDHIQSDSAHANLSDEKLQISKTKITNLKVHHVANLQRETMQRTIWMYIAQECASDTQVPQSLRRLKILLGDSEVREMVYAESRDIVIICMNMCLCFKFLRWQEGTLSS